MCEKTYLSLCEMREDGLIVFFIRRMCRGLVGELLQGTPFRLSC